MGGLFSSENEQRQRREAQERFQRQQAQEQRNRQYAQEDFWRRYELNRAQQEREEQIRRLEQEFREQQRIKIIQAQQEQYRIQQERLRKEQQERTKNDQYSTRELTKEIKRIEEERIKKAEVFLLQYNRRKYTGPVCATVLRKEPHFSSANNISLEVVDDNPIKVKFMNTTQKHFKISEVKRNLNPYIKSSYLLRKKEYEILHGRNNIIEELVFHGTQSVKLVSIQKNNFNWRLHGNARGNIFGKGVSFTPISNYASNYCDKHAQVRCMYGVRVLKGIACLGNKNMIFPPLFNDNKGLHYDTSEKPDGHVIVKYRDDEFYPEYLIYFRGFAVKKQQQKAKNVHLNNQTYDCY